MLDKKVAIMNETDRVDYLLECFRTALEELLTRVKHRDDWMKIQLLVQASLLALAQGIELGNVNATTPHPSVLAVSPAISLVLAGLYYVEDNLIGYLSKYIGTISEVEMNLRKGSMYISNWDSSKPLREYAKRTLPLRLVAQVATFIVIPIILVVIHVGVVFSTTKTWPWIELIVHSIILLLIILVTYRGFVLRRQTGQKSISSI